MRPNSYAMSVKLPDKNIDLTHTTCLTYKCRQLVHWHIDGQQALFQLSLVTFPIFDWCPFTKS